MRSLGNFSSASVQNDIDSSLLDELNASESAINGELDEAPLETSPYSHNLVTRLKSDSFDALDSLSAHPLSIEDPIVTYDSVVTQMITDGAEWIPPDQIAKEFSDVLLVKPDPAQSQNMDGSDDVTTPRKVQLEVTPNNGCPASRPTKSSDLPNKMAFVQHPSSDANDLSVSENVSKLRELQFQLNQEKATRKHQEDYIQQLQRYYDNLLAKHAAAETTIDHLRFRAKVGCDDSTPIPALPTTPGNSSFNTLRSRKPTSASLDTCVPAALSRRPHQTRVSGSVTIFRDKSIPTRSQSSLNHNQKASIQPQVHLMPLSSSNNHSERDHLDDGLEYSKCGPSNAINGNDTVSSGDDGADFDEAANRPAANADLATRDAAKALENQLNASLAAIHERLDAIEARLLDDHRNEAIAATHHDLEDLRRRYQAGQYLWSDDDLFDSQAVIGSRLDRLWQRLQQAMDGADAAPPRPSSLSLVDSYRTVSANANYTTIPTAATGISSLGPADLYREGSSSSSSSVHQRASNVTTAAASTDSREAAEAHFSRLLARYNKLKIAPGDWKDVESLMQVKYQMISFSSRNIKRMLQLSDRYSAQSSIMLSPKSLRRMFESDYGINNGVSQASAAKPSVQTYSQSTVPKTVKDASIMSRQMVSPDSGVPQTPLGSSGSSGASCYSTAGPRSSLVRQKSTVATAAPLNEAPTDSQRKQSDSGFWATDTCSAAALSPSPFKGGLVPSSSDTTTNTDEFDVDNNISRPSKMLPDEVMSLEADIMRLRKGIARLTSTASVSAPRCCESGAGSGSSNSTYGENPPRKKLQRPLNGVSVSTLSRLSKSSGHSSANVRQPRLPTSSSSSDEDVTYSTCNRPCHHSRSRHHVAAVNNSNDVGPSLEVIGSSLTPQQRNLTIGSTRTYYHNSSRPHLQSSRTENRSYRHVDTPGHRRSRSSTGQRVFYHPCSSCGGSGYNLNTIGHSENEALDSSVHSRTTRQTPTIRLPVQQDCNGWMERVYGMQELYGSALSPQPGRAYNTIGHQPSTSLSSSFPLILILAHFQVRDHPMERGWSNHSHSSWAPGGPALLPATSSPLILQRGHRRTRRYVPSKSQSLSHGDTTSSSSEDETRVVGASTSSCLCNHYRHRSSSRQTELEDFSSTSSGAYAAARCVTQIAQRLNSKLARHQDRHRTPVRQSHPHQRLPSHRRSSRSSHRDGDNSCRQDF
ncbi:unnamed protein product [Taenia asiatica]|uniref:AKNA domain-containing protein n=1 Tax=Taenia asiatica TaxID=60517 RepID=A0A0R3VU28_TAEAS|nr:unnamed protein product [Taenia asiatica]